MESLRVSAAGSETRIIAVAHNCSDRTAERAAKAGAEVVIYNDPQAKGKGSALAVGFAYAASQGMDAVLVVDADSTVSSNLIGVVREAIANGAEAVQCRYEMDSSSKRPATRLTALAFRGFNVVRPAGRNRLGLSAGIVGNGFAIRQTVLAQNSYNSLSVVEDLEFHIRLVLSGKKVQFLDDARVSSAMPSSKQGDATQRSRWEGGRANAARTWFVPLLKQLMRGRLRMLEPLLDLTSLPIGYAAFLLLIAGCFPLVWLRVYALLAVTVIGVSRSGCSMVWDTILPGICAFWLACLVTSFGSFAMLPSLLRSSRPEAAWVRTERQPALQTVSLETAADSVTPPLRWNTCYGSAVHWRSHETDNASGEVALCGAASGRECAHASSDKPVRQATRLPSSDPQLKVSPMKALQNFEPAENEEYALGPGDEISLDFPGRPELGGKKVVGPDGRITLSLVGPLNVADKNRNEVAKMVVDALSPYYKDLTVTVNVDKYGSNRIVIHRQRAASGSALLRQYADPAGRNRQGRTAGQCRRQRSEQRGGRRTRWNPGALRDLPWQRSGGLGRSEELLQSGNSMADLRLRRNDIVFVPAQQEVFVSVLGSVMHAGAIALTPDSTLASVLAQAGGLAEGAAANIQVIQPSTGKTSTIPFQKPTYS